jgi:hypothetical protein
MYTAAGRLAGDIISATRTHPARESVIQTSRLRPLLPPFLAPRRGREGPRPILAIEELK